MGKITSKSSTRHIVVGVGASAGGLQALTDFFETVSPNKNYTYVVVQHLSPDHKSLMAELLQKNTPIPISVIEEDTKMQSGYVYLIPPSKNLLLEGSHFKLIDKPKNKQLNLPIDLFFESLAQNFGDSSVGIILSGTGSDGSRGIRAIKEGGGVVVVQNTEQAKFDGMPQSAINTGIVDFILPVEKMTEEIENFFSTARKVPDDTQLNNDEELVLGEIIHLIKKETDLDFTFYKRPTIVRRLYRRVGIVKAKSLKAYYDFLLVNPEEIQTLHKEILIGVTKFFRDVPLWDLMADDIIPQIVSEKVDGDTIKVWEVGCSTGEETFSLAMLFDEEIEKQGKDIELKIFATDISQHHLEIASLATYGEGIVNDITRDRLTKFFNKTEKGYKVKDSIRKNAIFSNHNIISDTPLKNMDLVMCRNLLIYLKPSVQKNVIKVLHYATKLQNYLVLGSSENLGEQSKYFSQVSRKWKIFKNVETSVKIRSEVLKTTISKLEKLEKRQPQHQQSQITSNSLENHVKLKISNAILDQFQASSVYIDAKFNIIEAMGSFYKYASLPKTGFSTNLLDMIPEELAAMLLSSVRKAGRNNSTVIVQNMVVESNNNKRTLDVLIKPFFDSNHEDELSYVITFLEKEPQDKFDVIVADAKLSKSAKARIKDLELELKETRQDVINAIEDTETSNEELQATNEELLASNEELQSTNEELQSVNEELHTVNAEHIQKVEDLASANADMNNLLASTDIGTVFVDSELIIRRFTPAIQDHFDLLPQDIGRPIENFRFHAKNGDSKLVPSIKKAIQHGTRTERKILSANGKHFIKRISPFINADGQIDGATITFFDITNIHLSEEEKRKSDERFKLFYESDPVMHASINPHSGKLIECNKTFVNTLGYDSKKEVLGRPIIDFYDEGFKGTAVSLIQKFTKEKKLRSEEVLFVRKNGDPLPLMLNSDAVVDKNGEILHSRSTLVDISELNKNKAELKAQKEDLLRLNKDLEQFVSICSHDLQEPLSTIRFSSDFLQKKYSDGLPEKGLEYLGYIHEASGRMSNQIKGLLEHSRIGNNLKLEKVNVQEMLEVVKYDLKKRIDECEAKIHIGKMPKLMAYKIEIRLLFQNLMGNALKYCKEGIAPEIRVSSFEDDHFWNFSITDNGIGIEEKDLDSIFTIFGRVPTETKYEGTGVGLAHCEKIVKLHNGKMWVDSQLGVGSTFYFKIDKSL